MSRCPLRINVTTSVPSLYMVEYEMVGDYFKTQFYSKFEIRDEAIVTSPEAVELIAQIFQEENNSENSQFVKEIAIAEGVDGYVTDCDVFLDSYKSTDGLIRDIPISFCYQLTDQRIIDFIKERRQFIFDELQIPNTKNRHLRRAESVQVSKVTVSNNRLSISFEFSFHVTEGKDFFIEQLGKNRFRYRLKNNHHGETFFTVKTSFHQELT